MLRHIDSGLFQMGGGTLAGNTVDGSAIIARAKSEADIMSVLKTDIYARSGVWDLEKVKFIPVGTLIPERSFVNVRHSSSACIDGSILIMLSWVLDGSSEVGLRPLD